MLDRGILRRFVHEFYGYGAHKAPIWFVGMEEGGGRKFEQVAGRLNAWQKRGCMELEDLADYHREFGVTQGEPRSFLIWDGALWNSPTTHPFLVARIKRPNFGTPSPLSKTSG